MKEISRTAQKACPQIRIFNEEYIQQVHQRKVSRYSIHY